MVIQETQIDFWDNAEFKAGEKRPQIHLKKESKIYRQAEKILNDFTKRIPSKINYTTKILAGDPTGVILNYSKKNKPNMIIMGSRRFSKLLLGIVSTKVSDHVLT